MRGLKYGSHSVSFWAPYEVVRKICALRPSPDLSLSLSLPLSLSSSSLSSLPDPRIESPELLRWVLHNTVAYVEDALVSFSQQGIRHHVRNVALEAIGSGDPKISVTPTEATLGMSFFETSPKLSLNSYPIKP